MYTDPTGHWQQGDENLTTQARVDISRLTDLYYSAKTQAEKDAIHNAANAIRNNTANIASTPQNSVTGQKANNILNTTSNKDANGNAYMTASQWNSISTTKSTTAVASIATNLVTSSSSVKNASNFSVSGSQSTYNSGYSYANTKTVNASSYSQFAFTQSQISPELLYLIDEDYRELVDNDLSTNWDWEGIKYGFKQQALDIPNMFIAEYNKNLPHYDTRPRVSLLNANHKEPFL